MVLSFFLPAICIPVIAISGSIPTSAWTKTIPANKYGESGDAKGTYFRLYAEYLVGGSEKLVFDFQVSCGNHIFDDGRVVHGYLPALYAQKTASGAAVMLATPRICDAIRFAEDRPVADEDEFRHSWKQVIDGMFIPFTVWFDEAGKLTHGYGYATASAYDNPASILTFIEASVEPSTAKDFKRWYSADRSNLLQEFQVGPRFVTDENDKAYWATFDPEKELLPLACTGVAVTPHEGGPSEQEVRRYYPDHRPRYWLAPETLPATAIGAGPSKLDLVPTPGPEYYNSSPSREFPVGYNYLRHGKPDLRSSLSDDQPAFHPALRSDGYPFAGEGAFQNNRLTYTVDLRPEKKGLLSCAAPFNPIGYGTANFRQMYEYYFGPDYGPALADFGKTIDLVIVDHAGKATLEAIPQPPAMPHFLIGGEAAAEFVTFEFFGGGHVR